MQALAKLIKSGIVGGEVINSVVFAQNGFSDEFHSGILSQLTTPGAKVKSVVSVKNQIGEKTLEVLLRIIMPETTIVDEIKIQP